jgi:hypothetical protein
MDNTTLLAVIAMLDTQLHQYDQLSYMDDDQFGAMWALNDFRNHLQSHIEAQLNAVELETGE